MRIVAVADTHCFEHSLGAIAEGDVFVHAGDLCRGGELDELKRVANWIQALPHRHKIVVAGNHDWCFMNAKAAAIETLGSNIHYLEDSGVTIDGIQFWGSPWQPEFNDWAFNLPRGEALAAKWSMIPVQTDVLITHGPPMSIGDRSGDSARLGCSDLFSAVERIQPALHLFGHIHQDGGLWHLGKTTLANVTTWECERRESIFELNPDMLQAQAIFIPPARKLLTRHR